MSARRSGGSGNPAALAQCSARPRRGADNGSPRRMSCSARDSRTRRSSPPARRSSRRGAPAYSRSGHKCPSRLRRARGAAGQERGGGMGIFVPCGVEHGVVVRAQEVRQADLRRAVAPEAADAVRRRIFLENERRMRRVSMPRYRSSRSYSSRISSKVHIFSLYHAVCVLSRLSCLPPRLWADIL